MDIDLSARVAHPAGPGFQSWLVDGYIMKAAGQVDIQGRGADIFSVHLDVCSGGRGADMSVYVGPRSRRP
jgi:hypothetical protein